MPNFRLYPLSSFYIIDRFEDHEILQALLLDSILNSDFKSLNQQEGYFSDNISRVDWNLRDDFNRKWVKLLLPNFEKTLASMFLMVGFQRFKIKQIWFQTYEIYGKHGWHVHSSNFTGVYYLKLSEKNPKTQLLDPYNRKNIIEPDVQEGDILLFPSSIIHRAPENLDLENKVIISFNIDVDYIDVDLLENLK
jgi:hypothetical protein